MKMLEWEEKRNQEAAERADRREQVGPTAIYSSLHTETTLLLTTVPHDGFVAIILPKANIMDIFRLDRCSSRRYGRHEPLLRYLLVCLFVCFFRPGDDAIFKVLCLLGYW